MQPLGGVMQKRRIKEEHFHFVCKKCSALIGTIDDDVRTALDGDCVEKMAKFFYLEKIFNFEGCKKLLMQK